MEVKVKDKNNLKAWFGVFLGTHCLRWVINRTLALSYRDRFIGHKKGEYVDPIIFVVDEKPSHCPHCAHYLPAQAVIDLREVSCVIVDHFDDDQLKPAPDKRTELMQRMCDIQEEQLRQQQEGDEWKKGKEEDQE